MKQRPATMLPPPSPSARYHARRLRAVTKKLRKVDMVERRSAITSRPPALPPRSSKRLGTELA